MWIAVHVELSFIVTVKAGFSGIQFRLCFNEALSVGILFSLIGGVSLLDKIGKKVSGAALRLRRAANGEEEAEKADEGVHETHDLPEGVVVFITSFRLPVEANVDFEIPHHQRPESPWHEVLDREGPPEDEERSPPSIIALKGLIGALNNLSGEVVGAIEENVSVPFSSGLRLFEEERDHHSDKGNDPEDNDADVGRLLIEGEHGHRSHNQQGKPVDDRKNTDGDLVFAFVELHPSEHPGGTEALADTQDEHQVHGNVAVDHVEVGKAPTGAEEQGESEAEDTDYQSSQFARNLASPVGVVDNSGDSFNEGECSINSKEEEGDSEDEGPGVRVSHSLSGSRVGDEGESTGAGLVGHG